MKTGMSLGNKSAGVFKTFPEFSKLGATDKVQYESFIKDFPPYDDLSFATLMMWWNTLDCCAVSQLNGNLIISYWMPGIEEFSGLSVVGTHDIDATICAMFDHMKSVGETPRLVQVPEFVMSHMVHPELFTYKNLRSFDEYIVNVSKFFPASHAVDYRRQRIQKFLSYTGNEEVIVKSVDLSQSENRLLLLESAALWPTKGTVNDIVKMSNEALTIALENPDTLATENVCLYVGGELQAYILYHLPADRRYAIFSHAKVNDQLPYTYDYMVYAFSKWFADHEIIYLNLASDLGLPTLRSLKLALGPANYLRKYIIEPAK